MIKVTLTLESEDDANLLKSALSDHHRAMLEAAETCRNPPKETRLTPVPQVAEQYDARAGRLEVWYQEVVKAKSGVDVPVDKEMDYVDQITLLSALDDAKAFSEQRAEDFEQQGKSRLAQHRQENAREVSRIREEIMKHDTVILRSGT